MEVFEHKKAIALGMKICKDREIVDDAIQDAYVYYLSHKREGTEAEFTSKVLNLIKNYFRDRSKTEVVDDVEIKIIMDGKFQNQNLSEAQEARAELNHIYGYLRDTHREKLVALLENDANPRLAALQLNTNLSNMKYFIFNLRSGSNSIKRHKSDREEVKKRRQPK